jgi:GntR family transcriptional regulator/MocR family aminotransferase
MATPAVIPAATITQLTDWTRGTVVDRGPVADRGKHGPAVTDTPICVDFRSGLPDVAGFPWRDWLATLRTVLTDAPDAALGYADPRGTLELNLALADCLGRVRGVVTSSDRIVVCNGVAQGLAPLGRVLAASGRHTMAVEDQEALTPELSWPLPGWPRG